MDATPQDEVLRMAREWQAAIADARAHWRAYGDYRGTVNWQDPQAEQMVRDGQILDHRCDRLRIALQDRLEALSEAGIVL